MLAGGNLSKLLYKIELYLIKIIPIIIAFIYLLNTILSYFYIDLPILSYAVMGLLVMFLYISSYVFKFCSWHRVCILYIIINLVTYTDPDKRTSIVGIANTSSQEEFLNTIVHEAKHVQSHICKYYNVPEDGEQAACLIGYIVQKMHRVFKNMISTGTR